MNQFFKKAREEVLFAIPVLIVLCVISYALHLIFDFRLVNVFFMLGILILVASVVVTEGVIKFLPSFKYFQSDEEEKEKEKKKREKEMKRIVIPDKKSFFDHKWGITLAGGILTLISFFM